MAPPPTGNIFLFFPFSGNTITLGGRLLACRLQQAFVLMCTNADADVKQHQASFGLSDKPEKKTFPLPRGGLLHGSRAAQGKAGPRLFSCSEGQM